MVTRSGTIVKAGDITAPMSMAHNAVANVDSARWISQDRQMPTGSEDGNATSAQGIFFAHGMQTPVTGWGYPDIYKNQKSGCLPVCLSGGATPSPRSSISGVKLQKPFWLNAVQLKLNRIFYLHLCDRPIFLRHLYTALPTLNASETAIRALS